MSEHPPAPEARAGLSVDFTLRRAAFLLRARLEAPPGLTALLGPSGAGKTLTLQAIAGLAPIERGAITLNGRTLDAGDGASLPARARRIGYVPQNYALFPHLTVGANIAYGLPQRRDRTARDKRVADLLRLARLPGYEARSTRDLSGGEAQRVALARALAAEPEALLLDEPFSALDTTTRVAVREDLREIVLASGLPSLLVTHDLSEALALASRVVVLAAGRVIAQGPAEQVTARPATAVAARLLGWSVLLDVARVERGADDVCVTLAHCGQSLLLRSDECEPLAANAATARLALRPERLAVARDDGEALSSGGEAAVARGVVRSISQAGPLWSALVALGNGLDASAVTVSIPFTARESRALGLAPGDHLRLGFTSGAARLVAADGAGEEAAR